MFHEIFYRKMQIYPNIHILKLRKEIKLRDLETWEIGLNNILFKKDITSWGLVLKPVILTTWKAEIKRMEVGGQSG
jgi:hypothetical protein